MIAISLLSVVLLYALNKKNLIGTYKYVTGKMTVNDTTTNFTIADVDAIKIITPTQFSIISNRSNGSLELPLHEE
ncbi:MAG TPA: hypothetical protein VM888_09940 [Chitinophagaceae bacterium]|nr:hypothetical protein [Chitinophagaceae bacterium]